MTKLKLFTLFILMSAMGYAQENSFADHWEYVGIAVEEAGYTIWGTSPILDDQGQVHLFVARWPGELKVDPGWRSHSEIAHYVGTTPEGPFKFSDLALTGRGPGHWDASGPHNPAIHQVGEFYYLLYIANDNPNTPPHPSNQCIGMARSTSLYGPWERVNGTGLILSTPTNPAYWNYQASNGVNNPALLQHPDGGFFLYFKSEGGKMGLAIAEDIEGPYVQLPQPVTYNERSVEDGYAFMMDEQFCLLTTDNHGMLQKGGGILWTSADGIRFSQAEKGFHPVGKYVQEEQLKNRTRHYGGEIVKFERPQLLLINDKPAYLYAPSGYHFFGADATASYVLKYIPEEPLTVITYNIWNGFDWGKDQDRLTALAAWLRDQEADVIAFQELCGYTLERLEQEAKLWGHSYVALLKESGYSVGLTSNAPIEIKTKVRSGLHHGALHAKSHGIDFLVVHLHPGSYAFRRQEVPILLETLDEIRESSHHYLVLGDFNAHSPLDLELYPDQGDYLKHVRERNESQPIKGNLIEGKRIDFTVMADFLSFPLVDLVVSLGQAVNERGSFPGLVLSKVQDESISNLTSRLERIDYIMASPALSQRCLSAKTIRGETTDWLSDHYPVVAKFRK